MHYFVLILFDFCRFLAILAKLGTTGKNVYIVVDSDHTLCSICQQVINGLLRKFTEFLSIAQRSATQISVQSSCRSGFEVAIDYRLLVIACLLPAISPHM